MRRLFASCEVGEHEECPASTFVPGTCRCPCHELGELVTALELAGDALARGLDHEGHGLTPDRAECLDDPREGCEWCAAVRQWAAVRAR